jgi:hypothetical protein
VLNQPQTSLLLQLQNLNLTQLRKWRGCRPQIEHHNQQNMPLSGAVIQEKARSLCDDLKKDAKEQMTFVRCHAFQNLKMTGKAAALGLCCC